MAVDTTGGITYFLSIAACHKEWLGAIRQWTHLKVGQEEDLLWVRDLSREQVDSPEIRCIPYKQLYYASGPHLFLLNHHLPERIVPSLLWTPIDRGLPVRLPSLNHNFFGIHDTLSIGLVPSAEEQEAFALEVSLDVLEAYLGTAPAIRLRGLQWVVLDGARAMVTGTPLLPLQGRVYWRRHHFLVPAGYDFEWPVLADILYQKLGAEAGGMVVWSHSGSYFCIERNAWTQLSRSSFRLTIKQ